MASLSECSSLCEYASSIILIIRWVTKLRERGLLIDVVIIIVVVIIIKLIIIIIVVVILVISVFQLRPLIDCHSSSFLHDFIDAG